MYAPARRCTRPSTAPGKPSPGTSAWPTLRPILFTGCASESNNTAILGVAKANPGRRHIITTTVEHPAVLEVCEDLQRDGSEITCLDVDREGNLDLGQFVRALRPDTLLVSIMHANNETGVIFPIQQLARLTKETDPAIVFHCDATQSVGKMRIDLANEYRDVDLLSFSGHKLHAPKGIGVLYIRPRHALPAAVDRRSPGSRPPGRHREHALYRRPGQGLELAEQHLRGRGDSRPRPARPAGTIAGGRDSQCTDQRPRGPALPNTLNISCHFIEGEGMLYQLSDVGICASSGSACTSGSLEPSHVLRAMKVPFTAVHGSVRFSLSRYNTDEDIDHILAVFPGVVSNLAPHVALLGPGAERPAG